MKRLIILCVALAALPAGADSYRKAAPMSPDYVAECGSCHVAFPPELLGKTDWRKTMARLDKHFGSDASLDGKTGDSILAYLERHAGRYGRSLGSAEPRITTTSLFKREHHEVPAGTWKDARVKSAANCVACHEGAEKGSYGEGEIAMPGRLNQYRED